MGWIRGNKQKVEVLTLKMVLVCARDLQQIMIEDKKYVSQYHNTYHNITIRIEDKKHQETISNQNHNITKSITIRYKSLPLPSKCPKTFPRFLSCRSII